MVYRIIKTTVLLSFLFSSIIAASGKFYAYYTKLDYEDGISGPFADIVISYGEKGEFTFSRESGYLPSWKNENGEWFVDELVERRGDGDATRPDKNNIYSYVRIIKDSPEEIVVHWRYIPDFNNPNFDGVVHEYYTLLPNGIVTRKVKKGEGDLIDYHDYKNTTLQKINLSDTGIEQLALSVASSSNEKIPGINGPELKLDIPINPVRWFRFDEGLTTRQYDRRNVTKESITNTDCNIEGNISLWKSGISGSALAFDGYYSKVEMLKDNNPKIDNSFTVEAWIAMGAYPWMWGPIMDLTDNGSGLYFGINSIGQAGLRFLNKGKETIFKTDTEIGLYTWTHVAVSIDNDDLKLNIYIDGRLSKSANLTQKIEFPRNNDIVIGLNKNKMRATDHVSRDYTDGGRTPLGNQPMIYGIEGLLDEIKLYNVALTENDVKKTYNYLKPSNDIKINPDLEKRKLPGHVDGKNAEKFGAFYTNLKYHELWDNLWRSSPYSDIVVRFDDLPTSIIYWRGTNYGPGWVTENNIWMSDQSCEIYHEYGCAEHMADKQNRHSYVRLIENNDARVVVHWRYAAVDIRYKFENERVWADEYHYIYPDGSAVRYVTYHDEEMPGWQDVQFFSEPGSTPEDQINLQALTVANLDGDSYKLDWSNGVPENKLKNASISIVNFKSEYKVMVIYPEGDRIGTWGDIERATRETHFAGPWNHWPVGQMPNDGRYAMRNDRVTSSALGGAGPRDKAVYGFTNKDISELLPLARFWNRAPKIIVRSGASNAEYKMSEKAYHLNVKGNTVDIEIDASEQSPLYNPGFVLNNWNSNSAVVKIGGKVMNQGKNCRIGYRNTKDGKDLIVWLNMNESKKVKLSFSKK